MAGEGTSGFPTTRQIAVSNARDAGKTGGLETLTAAALAAAPSAELFTSTARIVHIDVMLTEGVLALFTSTKTEGCAEKKCTPPSIDKMKEKPCFSGLLQFGGRNRTRTCDPIDVNDVLYEPCDLIQFDNSTSWFYQLSHATIFCFVRLCRSNVIYFSIGGGECQGVGGNLIVKSFGGGVR